MKNKSVTSVVSVFLDIPRPELTAYYKKAYSSVHSMEWIKKRIDFFREWTLKSLRNQSFKDFRVFMLCSEKSRPLIDSYNWDANIEHCYDYGKANYEALDTDYVAITRLDSDDLFHQDAMKIIRENLILSDKVEKLFFSGYYRWIFHHNCFIYITNPFGTHKWSPSYTIIFPKSEYKNWLNIKKRWFVHVEKMCDVPNRKILPPNLVCVIRIKESTHHAIWKEDPLHKDRLEEELESAKKLGRKVTFSSGEHIEILKDFGISKEQYLGTKVDEK